MSTLWGLYTRALHLLFSLNQCHSYVSELSYIALLDEVFKVSVFWAYNFSLFRIINFSLCSKQEKDWTRRVGNDRHLICIEDPFETSHDLGRVVDKYSIKVLREEFERAAEIMQYDPNPSEALFQPYVPS